MRRPTEQLLFFFFRTACEAVLDPGNVGFLAHDGALELQKLLEQANGNLPIGKNENPELIRYAADIIRKYADGLSHDDRSVKEICEENSQNIA